MNFGTAWTVLYPKRSLPFDTSVVSVVQVRLREAQDFAGECRVETVRLLPASGAFGNFGPTAVEFIEAERRSVEKEQRLQEDRQQKLEQKQKQEFSRERCRIFGTAFRNLAPRCAILVVVCIGFQPESFRHALFLSFAAGVLVFNIAGLVSSGGCGNSYSSCRRR